MRYLPVCSAFLLAVGVAACSPTATHDVAILSPVSEPCDKKADPSCQPLYTSCTDLGVTTLRLAVGVFDREISIVNCPAELQSGPKVVQVSYRPGANFYMIDASFPRDGENVYIAAGPFPEDSPDAPWQVLLR